MKTDECPLLVYRLGEAEKDIAKVDERVDGMEGRMRTLEDWRTSFSAKVTIAAGAGSVLGAAAVTAAIRLLFGG